MLDAGKNWSNIVQHENKLKKCCVNVEADSKFHPSIII